MKPGYESYRQWKGWEGPAFGVCDTATTLYFVHELRRSGVADLQGRRILEIGFGNGVFAAWVRAHGADYVGTEVIDGLLEQGRANGFDVHSGQQPLVSFVTENTIDCVVAFDVFEHLEQEHISKLLEQIKVCLVSGGTIIARVPSGDSPFSRSIQHGDLTHRTTLGSSAVRQLAEAAGLEVICVREPTLPLWGLGLRAFVRRLGVVTLRKLVFPLVAQVLMGGGRPVLTPNLLFVLRKA
jgi:SAM-dependent methyltransferase